MREKENLMKNKFKIVIRIKLNFFLDVNLKQTLSDRIHCIKCSKTRSEPGFGFMNFMDPFRHYVLYQMDLTGCVLQIPASLYFSQSFGYRIQMVFLRKLIKHILHLYF